VTTATPHDRVVDRLLACAAEWSGFTPESVAREAVRRALDRELASGATLDDILRRAAAQDPQLVRVLRHAVGVRETYLFRNPEQFEHVAARIPSLAAGGVVRAWSAGCATGEEAWSLAATIVAHLPGQRADPTQVLVLGTDIDEPALATARGGTYRRASQRPSGPLLYPLVTARGDQLHVLDSLRPIMSFAAHDLRDPPPGEFEVIFCRNVLIYFKPEVSRSIVAHLAAALVPGGLLVFGTMDVDTAGLPGLLRFGRPELAMFALRPSATERARRRPTTLKVPKEPAKTGDPSAPAQALALHRSALLWIEIGGRGSVEKALVELNRKFPNYVPGLLERALAHVRKGDHAGARTWMTDVLKHLEGVPDDHPIAGLEELPASFYRDTARTYVDGAGKP
jgi:chemotaxis methyl-accepting protein methylase